MRSVNRPIRRGILALSIPAACACTLALGFGPTVDPVNAWLARFRNPPKEYTVVPFWFWNDELDEKEIIRQIDDFAAHGVHGFVIHPRIGLPESIGFMSDRYLHFVRLAVERAERKGMIVHLYDEGMYPSGSANGQVVKANPKHAARCLINRPLADGAEPKLEPNETLVSVATLADGKRIAIIDAPSFGKIRGIHFGQDDGEPNQPLAADLLNPEATQSFIRFVHEKYRAAVGRHFGKTVRAIFTDEPDMLGRRARRGAQPWTTGLEKELRRILGYDPIPRLGELWYSRGPESERFRREFRSAVNRRLEESYYAPLSRWCEKNRIALTGHPAGPGDIGVQRYFQIPGQDIVWRYVEPGKPSALEGEQSTTAKCSSSAAAHLGRKRNGNECFGAYGWSFTYREMEWLTNWLFVRGVNQITPHAFYYSLRGKRRDERPPDVGPNSEWWPRYKTYADYSRRMSWLLANGRHRAHLAILATSDQLPWRSAKAWFENQADFNYLEERHVLDGSARVTDSGILIRDHEYSAIVIEEPDRFAMRTLEALKPLKEADRIVLYGVEPFGGIRSVRTDGELVSWLRDCGATGITVNPQTPNLRYRALSHEGVTVIYLFNEGEQELAFTLDIIGGSVLHPLIVNPVTLEARKIESFAPWRLKLSSHEGLLAIFDNVAAKRFRR